MSTGTLSARWTKKADALCAKTLNTLNGLGQVRTPADYVRNLGASLRGYQRAATGIRELDPASSDPRVAGMLHAIDVRVTTLEQAQATLSRGEGIPAASKAIASHHVEIARGATFAFELGLTSCGSLITPR